MKSLITILVLGVLVGCQPHTAPPAGLGDPWPAPANDPQITVLAPELQEWLRFHPARIRQDADSPMQVEVPVRNLAERQYLIDYRIRFYDDNDLELPPTMGWRADQPVPASTAEYLSTLLTEADAGYFDTMGIPLLEGRHFSDTDRRGSPPVTVVTETFARQLWPSESALGKRVGRSPNWWEIVGVVGALRQRGLDAEPLPQMFVSLQQVDYLTQWYITIVAQTTGDPASIIGPVRAAIRAAHPDLVAGNIRSMDDAIAAQMAPRRFVMWTLGVFG